MNKTRGLILGKFAPFHVAHKHLIEVALKEVDEVYIIIYDCPDLTSIPLNVRASWIRHFFPQVHVIEGWDAPNRHEDTPEVKRLQERYVKKALNSKEITHFFSSEHYGEHMSKFLGAINRKSDRDNPISATRIRNGECLDEKSLNTVVYKDILIKVAFVGMPSREQSSLVRYVAKKLKTAYVEDNMLKLLSIKQGKNKNFLVRSPNFYKIANEKYKIANSKNKIFSGKKYLIYNSTGFVDHLLSIATCNQFNEKYYKFFSEDIKSYDLIFVNDVTKSSVGKFLNIDSSIFLNQLVSNLDTLGIDYKILSGTFKEKLLISERLIKSFKKRFD